MLLFTAGQLTADDTRTLISNYCFRYELQLVLEKAGFTVEAVKGDWTDADVMAEHATIVYFARKYSNPNSFVNRHRPPAPVGSWFLVLVGSL